MAFEFTTKLKCIPSDQGTATYETTLCEVCFAEEENQSYARDCASNADDIDSEAEFIDCSENEGGFNDHYQCVNCGSSVKNDDGENITDCDELYQWLVKHDMVTSDELF